MAQGVDPADKRSVPKSAEYCAHLQPLFELVLVGMFWRLGLVTQMPELGRKRAVCKIQVV